MKKIGISILFGLLLSSCGIVKKNTSYSEDRRVHVDANPVSEATSMPEPEKSEPESEPGSETTSSQADAVIETAMDYTGVRYKYGGQTRKGTDCSGLLYTSFLENDISLPRTSGMMAETGMRIKVTEVQEGDLLLFKTRRGKKINHVGLVVDVEGDDVKFIHSTSSRGVIVSSLREGY